MWGRSSSQLYYEIHGRAEREDGVAVVRAGWRGALLGAADRRSGQPLPGHRLRPSGTGKSPGSLPVGYSIADMAGEVASLLHELAVEKCSFHRPRAGWSDRAATSARPAGLIDRMVLVNAWAKTHPHTIRCFAARKSLLLNTGVAAYVAAQPLFLYPADWLARPTGLAGRAGCGSHRPLPAGRNSVAPHRRHPGVRSGSSNSRYRRDDLGRGGAR